MIQLADRLVLSFIFRAKRNEPIASNTITPNTVSTNQTGPSPLAPQNSKLPLPAPLPGVEVGVAVGVAVVPLLFVLGLSDGLGIGEVSALAVETGAAVGVGWAVVAGEAVGVGLGVVRDCCA
jgi:hypothetical protein